MDVEHVTVGPWGCGPETRGGYVGGCRNITADQHTFSGMTHGSQRGTGANDFHN